MKIDILKRNLLLLAEKTKKYNLNNLTLKDVLRMSNFEVILKIDELSQDQFKPQIKRG